MATLRGFPLNPVHAVRKIQGANCHKVSPLWIFSISVPWCRTYLRGLAIWLTAGTLILPVFGPFWSIIVRVVAVGAGAAGRGVVLRRERQQQITSKLFGTDEIRMIVFIILMTESHLLPVPSPPLRPPLLSRLFVSFPWMPVSLFFLLFHFFFLFFLLFLFVIIHLCSFFVFLLNPNALIIYFSIFQLTILSEKRKTATGVSITSRFYRPFCWRQSSKVFQIMSKTSD